MQNAVISFVTPAPGVNLRPYVDHYVGVNGQRGYLTDLQRQHISVQRVTVLDDAAAASPRDQRIAASMAFCPAGTSRWRF